MYETTKLWFQSGYIIYIYYTATPFPTVNQSHVKKNPYFIHFFLADSSAANSQNGGPGVCHFLVLVWASGVAGFSKMVSTPIVLQIPWCVGGPPNRRPEKAWMGGEKNTSWLGVLGEVLEDYRDYSDVIQEPPMNQASHQNSFSSSCTASFLLHRPLPTPLGWREASKAATCGSELVPTWRIIPLGKVVTNPHLSAIFADHLEGEQSQLGDLRLDHDC